MTVPAVARHPYLVVMIHGFWSFVLFLLNFLCIVVIGVLTFWMKEVHGESHDHAAAYSARFAQRKGMLRSMWKQVRAGAKDIAKRGDMTRTEFARKKNSADVGDVAQHAGHGFKSTLQKLRDHADEHAGEGRHRPRELRPRTHGTRSETPIEPSPPQTARRHPRRRSRPRSRSRRSPRHHRTVPLCNPRRRPRRQKTSPSGGAAAI